MGLCFCIGCSKVYNRGRQPMAWGPDVAPGGLELTCGLSLALSKKFSLVAAWWQQRIIHSGLAVEADFRQWGCTIPQWSQQGRLPHTQRNQEASLSSTS